MIYRHVARAAISSAAIAALVAAMFMWTATPALAACAPRAATTAHATWTLTRDPSSCEPSESQERIGETFERITVLGPRFVAIGQVAQDPATSLPRDWASFTSPDGRTWSQHPIPFTHAQLDPGFALASGGGRTVVVGAGFVGRSSDGATWEVGAGPPPASARVTALAFGGSTTPATGRWLAAGQTTKTGSRVALWLSTDGLRWSRIPDRTIFGRFCAKAVAASGRGYVVVGSNCTGTPSVLSSRDGRTWRRAPAQAAFARLGVVRDVVTSPSGFIAAGDDQSASGARGTAFWTSSDGVSWRRAAFFPAPRFGETFVTLVRTSAGYFGIGDTGGITDGRPPGSFYSATGATWRRDGLLPNYGYGSEDGDWMTDATASGSRIVAVGRYNDPDPGSYYAGGLITVGIPHR